MLMLSLIKIVAETTVLIKTISWAGNSFDNKNKNMNKIRDIVISQYINLLLLKYYLLWIDTKKHIYRTKCLKALEKFWNVTT